MQSVVKLALAVLLLGAVALPADAQQVRQLLNGMRAEQGLGPVTPSPRLEEAAMAHALDMAEGGFSATQDRTAAMWAGVRGLQATAGVQLLKTSRKARDP